MQIALAPDISTWPDADPSLVGSRCRAGGAPTFPVRRHCPKCSAFASAPAGAD